MRNRSELEQFRDRTREIQYPGRTFYLIPWKGITLDVIVSVAMGWEHVSLVVIEGDFPNNFDTRLPTHEEMVYLKNLFWANDEICIEVHPKKSEYVNFNEHCLHLWRHIGENYKQETKMIKEFISTFPANTSPSVHVTNLELYQKTYCIVTGPNRWPTWDEMCEIKRQYFLNEQAAVQYHLSPDEDLNKNFILVLASAPNYLPYVFQI